MVADGRAYAAHGIAGSFFLDAAVCIAACLLAGLLLSKFDRRSFRAIPQLPEIAVALQQEDWGGKTGQQLLHQNWPSVLPDPRKHIAAVGDMIPVGELEERS